MNCPEIVPLETVTYGDGAKGFAFQIARNDEFGVQCYAERKKRGAPWVETWTCDFLPLHAFGTFQELRAAMLPATRIDPPNQLLSVKPRHERSTGRCWQCHENQSEFDVRARLGWRKMDEAFVFCCADCLEAVKADPRAALESRRKWVRDHPGAPA